MARSLPLLTEAQWQKIAPLLPTPPQHRRGGRPRIAKRRVLEGIFWILLSGGKTCSRNTPILFLAGGHSQIGDSRARG